MVSYQPLRDPSSWLRNRIEGFTLRNVFNEALVATVYTFVAFGSLSLFATLNSSVSPVWPPTGLAIGVLLIWGPELLPGIFVGAFAANYLTTGNVPVDIAIAVGNTMEAVVGYWIIARFAGRSSALDEVRNLAVFIGACTIAPLVSATVGVTTLTFAGLASWPVYFADWITWWLGDASGALIISSLMISAVHPTEPAARVRSAEFIALALVTVLAVVMLFATTIYSSVPLISTGFMIVPVVAWAGLRFGSRGATGATFLLSLVATWRTLTRFGPFTSADLNTAFLSLQFNLMILATTGLALAALVHERIDAEEEARKAKAAERRFQTIVESSPDAIIIEDRDGQIVQVNSRGLEMFGYDSAELLRLKTSSLIVDQVEEQHRSAREILQKTPSIRKVSMETVARKRDGAHFPVEINMSPLQTDRELMVSNNITDISERQRAQAERALLGRMSAIGEATSMIGHDLRNPLQTISGAVYLTLEKLKDDPSSSDSKVDDVRKYLKKIQDQTVYMNKIVTDLQDYTRTLKPAAVPVDFYGLLQVVLSSVPKRDNVEVSMIFEEDSKKIMSDPLMLRRVFQNIIANALDAMPGGGKLLIEGSKEADNLKVTVTDNGIGMDSETLNKIFSPFFTTKPRGQGLGLSVSKRLIDALNGKIDVTSESGKGTRFTIIIPFGATDQK